MRLPWTVHEWIAEVANNPLVIDFVLDRFHTTSRLDLTTGSRWPVLTPMKLETGPLKEPVIINAEWWRKHPNNPANNEPKKEFGFLTPMTFPNEEWWRTHPLGC